MLINLSNHPSNQWSDKQFKTAIKKFKSVYDLPFPHISPKANSKQVKIKAGKYFERVLRILKSSKDKSNAVHLMGELTFVYQLTQMLKRKNITVIASTTDRIVDEQNEKKIVTFNFVRFREY
jgi:hypothetical protein